MCCLALTAGFLGPRIALFLWWVFGDKVDARVRHVDLAAPRPDLPAVDDARVRARVGPADGVSGIGWLVVALGFAGDIATYSSRAAKSRYQTTTFQ